MGRGTWNTYKYETLLVFAFLVVITSICCEPLSLSLQDSFSLRIGPTTIIGVRDAIVISLAYEESPQQKEIMQACGRLTNDVV